MTTQQPPPPNTRSALAASVIIPTMNRGAPLLELLDALSAQATPPGGFEVIIVDSSTDQTPELVRKYIEAHSGEPVIQYLREERVGVHYARHRGARAARGEIFVQIEDDAMPEPGWLIALLEPYAEADTLATGGRTAPRFEGEPPWWILEEQNLNYLSISSLGDKRREFRSGCPLYAVNMSVRRDLLFAVGGFNPDIMGPVLLGDGESGLQRKLFAAYSGKIVYVPEALVFHLLPASRLTEAYYRRRLWNEGATRGYMAFHEKRPGRVRLGLWILRALRRALIARIVREFRRGTVEYYKKYFWHLSQRREAWFYFQLIWNRSFRSFVEKQDWIQE